MKGKILISTVCLILVVGVVIGAVVIHNKNSNPDIVAHNNAVRTICQNTEDQNLCRDTMSSVKGTSDPNAFIEAAVKATTDSVIKAFNMSDRYYI